MGTIGPADSAGISPEDFEGGARRTGRMAALICILWSLFQLWVASDFPFYLSEVTGLKLVFNNQEARQLHLAFGLGLALSLYPAVRSVHPLFDRIVGWGLVIIGVATCLYLFIFKLDIANRAGLPNRYDLFFSIAGMLCVMVAVYRALGLPLLIVAMVFIIYVMFGHLDIFPDAMRWKGASLNKATWHFWMQTEGVFGVALGVSASMIFLFVLFGALLESAGAGNYFIKLSFAALGHLRGGPAKAAVVASGLSGIYSGSSIADVVTTGTFTIPLMKKTGLSAEKAGAVEVASSTNGQLTPPVMGAVVVTTIGMLAFCSATQRFLVTRNRLWETLLLLLVAFTMFRPDFWLDRWVPPFETRPGAEIVDLLAADNGAAAPRDLRVRFVGPDFDDASRMVTRNTIIQVPPTDDPYSGLADAGVVMTLDDGRAVVGEPFPGTPLFRELQGFDFYADDTVTLDMVLVEITDRPAREWVYLPAALLLGVVLLLQRRRRAAITAA